MLGKEGAPILHLATRNSADWKNILTVFRREGLVR
jgi:hypothetical protein